MFELTRYNINRGALAITAGVSLASAARVLASTSDDKITRSTLPSLLPPKASSSWTEWALSGYLGNFLGWAGEKLAEIGSEAFPAPSIVERRVVMRENRRLLKQLFAESLIGEDVEQELHETLNLYLRHGLVLMKADILEPKKWRQELLSLQNQAKRVSAEHLTSILGEWIEQLAMLQKNQLKADMIKKIENRANTVPIVTQYPNPFELSSLDGSNGFQLNGISPNELSGVSVSRLGDINGDGYSDIAIGANYASPDGRTHAGQVYIVFGKADIFGNPFELSKLNGNNGFQINGASENDWCGWSVNGAGDVNGDGFDDVLIGCHFGTPSSERINAGETYVVFGQSIFTTPFELSNLNGSNGFQINGISAGDESSTSISGAGDVNGDGYADILIGAFNACPGGGCSPTMAPGQSYLVFGGQNFTTPFELSTLNGDNGFMLNGSTPGEQSGFSVSGAEDVNGDGYDDFLIGMVTGDPDQWHNPGRTYLVFGNSTFSSSVDLSSLNGINGVQINGITPGDTSGCCVSGAGDVNGDGYADLIIGAGNASPGGRSNAGETYVVFGQAIFTNPLELSSLNGNNGFQMNGALPNDAPGISVSGAGDMNGDGYDDVIIGAVTGAPSDVGIPGRTYVVFGRPNFTTPLELSDLNGFNGFQLNGVMPSVGVSTASHRYVTGIEDINGDGYNDILIGAYAVSPEGRFQAGQSYVVSGLLADSKKQSHLARNFIIGGVIAGGLLATGLFCFFHRNKNDFRGIYENDVTRTDELISLNQEQDLAKQSREGFLIN